MFRELFDMLSWVGTGEGKHLMMCDVFIGRGVTWQCICVVYFTIVDNEV